MERAMTLQQLRTDDAPVPTGPFSQGVRVGSLVFTAGQAGRNRETGQMGDIKDQTTWALRNVAAILAAAGASLVDVAKVTIFVREGSDVQALNAAYVEAFRTAGCGDYLPARSLVFVSSLKNPDMLVEIETIAALA